MVKDTKFSLKVVLIAAAGAVLFVASVVGVYVVGERQARYKTEELLDYACTDLPSTMRGNLASVYLFETMQVAGRLDATHPPSAAEMRQIVNGCALDELHLVNKYGKVLASSAPAAVGRDLTTIPAMIDFLSLVESPDLIVKQPIRLSIADDNTEVSYGGFPQSDGSLILCGYYVSHLRDNFIASGADLMLAWKIGETGAYVIVDDATGRLVFDYVAAGAKTGEPFAGFGDPAALKADFDVETTHVGVIGGVLCHYRVFDFYGLRVVACLPHDEFYASVKVMTAAVAIVLLLVFAVFGIVFRQVMATHRALAQMREAEDRQRLKDMVMATSIQKHSLPTVFPPFPDRINDFDIYAFMQTAKEVGGDFYDFYFVDQNRIALVVADVSGKGVPAAMFMMRAKTTLHGLLKAGAKLSEAVAKASDHLCEGNLEDMFVTAWIGICDLTSGEVEYVNAGHNPPLVRRADGSVEWVRQRSGLVLAAMPGAPYRSHRLALKPGDSVVLYTDGVTEAQNAKGELYGEDRLERVSLGTEMDKSALQYCDGVMASLADFVGTAEQADDITMLAFRLKRILT